MNEMFEGVISYRIGFVIVFQKLLLILNIWFMVTIVGQFKKKKTFVECYYYISFVLYNIIY